MIPLGYLEIQVVSSKADGFFFAASGDVLYSPLLESHLHIDQEVFLI
jgi:hypothetical protein